MSYRDVFFSRVNHMGETTAERIRQGGIRSFYKWMAESPHTVRQLSVERGIHFDGIILTKVDKEYRKDMYLNVANDIPLKVGDIMNWAIDDGSIEKWLLLQEEKKVNGTYRTFFIVRCNYLLKWIDGQGHRQQSWAYFVSSVDSKVKGNYRTWHNLITPQPNKYAEIVMPYYPVDRSTNFIVQNESWNMVEADFSSVPGTIYMSLTENKVNLIYDDLDEPLADTDKEAKYSFIIKAPTEIAVGMIFTPDVVVMKNNVVFECDESYEFKYNVADPWYIEETSGGLKAKHPGTVTISVTFKNYPTAIIDSETNSFTCTVVESGASTERVPVIVGDDYIREGWYAIYTLKDYELGASYTWSILPNDDPEDDKWVTLEVNKKDNSAKVTVKKRNKASTFTLQASVNGVTINKVIEIRSLWT